MDSIINKLTEIESAASAIVQHAEAEKSALDEKFDKKRMDFDKELEADTQRQIQGIRDKLESETSRILSGQSQESQDELDALQKEYDDSPTDHRGIAYGKSTGIQWYRNENPGNGSQTPYPGTV